MTGRNELNVEQEVVVVVAVVALASGVAWVASSWLSTDNLALVFLIAVTVAGGFLGLRAALVASGAGFLAYNFLFTEPRFTLAVAHSDDVTSLIAFLIVSVIVGQLAGRLRERAAEARRNAERVNVLFDFSRRIATAVDERDLLMAARDGIGAIIGQRCDILPAGPDGALRAPVDVTDDGLPDAATLAAAQRAYEADEPGIDTPEDRWFEPITGFGVIVVESSARGHGLDEEGRRLLFALRVQLGAAWERLRLHHAAADARIDAAAVRLRASLLASVSHDLRTPLVSIIGSLTALREVEVRLSPADRMALLDTALAEADRLNRLVQNLLDMTRLSHGGLRPRLAAVNVGEAIAEAVRRLASLFADRTLTLHIDDGLPPARADRTLLDQVLVNLLENAAKYSPSTEPVTLIARRREGAILISVVDRGIGIPVDQRVRVFEPFNRAGRADAEVSGHGLGLPICHGFVEAMQGTITVRDGENGRGTAIDVELPAWPDGVAPGVAP